MRDIKQETYPLLPNPRGMHVTCDKRTGIKLTHIPTGLSVIGVTEKSMYLNAEKAKKELSILLNEDLKRGDV